MPMLKRKDRLQPAEYMILHTWAGGGEGGERGGGEEEEEEVGGGGGVEEEGKKGGWWKKCAVAMFCYRCRISKQTLWTHFALKINFCKKTFSNSFKYIACNLNIFL